MHSAWTERSRHHIHKGRIPPKIRALITRLLSAEKVGSLLWWVEKLWLSPVQVKILPIADRHHEYADSVRKMLEAKGLRVEVDTRSEKIGYKIREAQLQKINYMLVVGDNEVEGGTVSVRKRGEGDIGSMEASALADMLKNEVDTKAL